MEKLFKCGQICTVGIKLNNFAKQQLQKQFNAIRRGMVLVEQKSNPKYVHQFLAQLFSYHSNSNKKEIKITQKYQPVVNIATIRQMCNIVSVENEEKQDKIETPEELQKKESKLTDNIDNKYQQFSMSKNKTKTISKNNAMLTSLDGEKLEYEMQNLYTRSPQIQPNLNQAKFRHSHQLHLKENLQISLRLISSLKVKDQMD